MGKIILHLNLSNDDKRPVAPCGREFKDVNSKDYIDDYEENIPHHSWASVAQLINTPVRSVETMCEECAKHEDYILATLGGLDNRNREDAW